MASSQKTRFGLNKWIGADKPTRTDFVNDNTKIDSRLVAPGSAEIYFGAIAPDGWLLCDGASISRTTYAELFAVLGTTYGTGNGTTTFNVPDMRGRVPVGCDANFALGSKGGSQTQTLSITNINPFTLRVGIYPSEGGSRPGGISGYTNNGANDSQYSTASAGSGTPISMMQPYIATNYIIKT